jgi:hypothetical protein
MDTYSNLLYVKEQRVELAHLAHRYYMQDSYYCISMSHSKRHKQGCYLLVTWRVVSGPPRRRVEDASGLCTGNGFPPPLQVVSSGYLDRLFT